MDLVSVRSFFSIYLVFSATQKQDRTIRKRNGKRERVYPTRIYGIPFSTGLIPFLTNTGCAKLIFFLGKDVTN